MRRLTLLAALFSLSAAQAQEGAVATPPAYGRELPRTELIPYASEAEALAAPPETKYRRYVYDWTREDRPDGRIRFTSHFNVPFAWANRQVLFHLPAAPAEYTLLINGREAGGSDNGNDPADYNITPLAKEGANTIELLVARPSASAVAPLESWKQEEAPEEVGRCYVFSQPTLRVRDVEVARTELRDDGIHAEIALAVRTHSLNPRTSRIHYELRSPAGDRIVTGFRDVTLDMRREDTVRFTAAIPLTMAWSAEQPTCYTLLLRTQHEGRMAEYQAVKLGFRTLEVRDDGTLAVNGVPLQPKVRTVAPDIHAYEIATLRERGFNVLQVEAGVLPQQLLRDCDQIGMYVVPTAAINTSASGPSIRKGGNPSNDPAWKEHYLSRTLENYHTTKNHPSVIGFSLGEKSANGINLYESYLMLKDIEHVRPVIYPDAGGEWNSDRVTLVQ